MLNEGSIISLLWFFFFSQAGKCFKEALLLLLDVSPSMHTFLPELIYSKNDEVGIVLFGTEGKRQDINKHQKRRTKYTRCIQVCYRAEEEERK
ncbi:hypothetical protein CK203_069808 [Vitis vinifera]|uniref:Ku70/Ku80 N-terminal alpha/beta domain-containing protein n=1 Tax=Vitis vinifera TaxID=29760 RepID=A0A438E067_VITVI|nr:hypothetical protein CK203_069808 [Vitis vinifera]